MKNWRKVLSFDFPEYEYDSRKWPYAPDFFVGERVELTNEAKEREIKNCSDIYGHEGDLEDWFSDLSGISGDSKTHNYEDDTVEFHKMFLNPGTITKVYYAKKNGEFWYSVAFDKASDLFSEVNDRKDDFRADDLQAYRG